MIFAFSTSSPIASVAIFDESGSLLFADSKLSEMKASEVCLSMIEKSGFDPRRAKLFLADIGPGSFTGTRVAVTIAKTLAFVTDGQCGGANAFDLIGSTETVILPSKKGEWFIRRPGVEPIRDTSLPSEPYIGFGPNLPDQTYPLAEQFGPLIPNLKLVSPFDFLPAYLIEPSISIQTKNLGLSGAKK